MNTKTVRERLDDERGTLVNEVDCLLGTEARMLAARRAGHHSPLTDDPASLIAFQDAYTVELQRMLPASD